MMSKQPTTDDFNTFKDGYELEMAKYLESKKEVNRLTKDLKTITAKLEVAKKQMQSNQDAAALLHDYLQIKDPGFINGLHKVGEQTVLPFKKPVAIEPKAEVPPLPVATELPCGQALIDKDIATYEGMTIEVVKELKSIVDHCSKGNSPKMEYLKKIFPKVDACMAFFALHRETRNGASLTADQWWSYCLKMYGHLEHDLIPVYNSEGKRVLEMRIYEPGLRFFDDWAEHKKGAALTDKELKCFCLSTGINTYLRSKSKDIFTVTNPMTTNQARTFARSHNFTGDGKTHTTHNRCVAMRKTKDGGYEFILMTKMTEKMALEILSALKDLVPDADDSKGVSEGDLRKALTDKKLHYYPLLPRTPQAIAGMVYYALKHYLPEKYRTPIDGQGRQKFRQEAFPVLINGTLLKPNAEVIKMIEAAIAKKAA
jgi:hypothetical protein